jgi:glycine/D-amino acid oxidase-like deaminating enzyme
MPRPPVTPFHSDQTLPSRVDVAIIGGGIIGVSTALELAERGVSVALFEKGEIGGEQSSRNWGWVRMSQRDPREIPLMAEAIKIWEGLDARIGRTTGYKQTGLMFTAQNDKVFDNYTRWADHLAPFQMPVQLLRRDAMAEHAPGYQGKAMGGIFTPKDGRAEPTLAAPAIAEAARDAGARVFTGCAVRSLDMQGGKLAGVITEKGRVACDRVVLAGGAWSRLFAGNAGVELPQLKVLNSVMRTTPLEGGPQGGVWDEHFAIRRRHDGGYTVAQGGQNSVDLVPDSVRLAKAFLPAFRSEWRSLRFRFSKRTVQAARQARTWTPDEITPFEKTRILDPTPNYASLKLSWAETQRAFPIFRKARVVQSWAGMIDVTPDALPVISAVDEVEGLHIATGFSGHGFGIGPGAGRLMADLVTGATPVVDPHAYRLSRFTDGSVVRLESGF